MIFYFSATGNTKWAARQICKNTGDELLYIPDIVNKHEFTLKDGESIGFCFPVHGWRPPIIVREFVRRLHISNYKDNYCYAVCTAGDTVGETIRLLEQDLSMSGITLNSSFSLIMPEAYVGLPFMDVDTPQKEKQKINDADRTLQQYINHIRAKQRGLRNLTIGRWPRINSRLIGHLFLKYLVKDTPFRLNNDKCIKCGICSSICPVHDIKGGIGTKPEWLHNGKCLTCFSCYHHCPTKAISFGSATRNKGQYWYGHKKNPTLKQPNQK